MTTIPQHAVSLRRSVFVEERRCREVDASSQGDNSVRDSTGEHSPKGSCAEGEVVSHQPKGVEAARWLGAAE